MTRRLGFLRVERRLTASGGGWRSFWWWRWRRPSSWGAGRARRRSRWPHRRGAGAAGRGRGGRQLRSGADGRASLPRRGRQAGVRLRPDEGAADQRGAGFQRGRLGDLFQQHSQGAAARWQRRAGGHPGRGRPSQDRADRALCRLCRRRGEGGSVLRRELDAQRERRHAPVLPGQIGRAGRGHRQHRHRRVTRVPASPDPARAGAAQRQRAKRHRHRRDPLLRQRRDRRPRPGGGGGRDPPTPRKIQRAAGGAALDLSAGVTLSASGLAADTIEAARARLALLGVPSRPSGGVPVRVSVDPTDAAFRPRGGPKRTVSRSTRPG